MRFASVFFWGMLISFLGSLPLGTMNVASVHIAADQGVQAAMIYALGSMAAEIIIVRIGLVSMTWLVRRPKLFRILEFITLSLVILLAIASFIAAYKMNDFASSLPVRIAFPFWTGVLLSATNPLHIPFWLGWSTVLINKGVLQASAKQYNYYVVGIGLGTMMGFSVFIFAGSYFIRTLSEHQVMVNYIIGIILSITAIIQVVKMKKTKLVLVENPLSP